MFKFRLPRIKLTCIIHQHVDGFFFFFKTLGFLMLLAKAVFAGWSLRGKQYIDWH